LVDVSIVSIALCLHRLQYPAHDAVDLVAVLRLDPQGVVEMRTLVRRLGSGERTVLLSSHLLNEVEQVCDRVAIINHGRLIRQGTVHELRGQASLVVRATPQDAARRTLERLVGNGAVTTVDGTLRLNIDPQQAADLNAALVGAGIRVSDRA